MLDKSKPFCDKLARLLSFRRQHERKPEMKTAKLDRALLVAEVTGDWPLENVLLHRHGAGLMLAKVGAGDIISSECAISTKQALLWLSEAAGLNHRVTLGFGAAAAWLRILAHNRLENSPVQNGKVRIREAAKILGIGVSTLRQKIRRKEIGCEKLGHRSVFLYLAELESYQKRKQQNSHVAI